MPLISFKRFQMLELQFREMMEEEAYIYLKNTFSNYNRL